MPTPVHGTNTVVKLDNAAGSLTAITDYIVKVGPFGRPQETHDVTTLGNTSKNFMLGLKDGDQISIECIYDNALETILAAINALTTGASQSFEIHPEGTATGKPKYSVETFLANYNIDSSVNAPIGISITLQKTGAVTRGTN
ncbi:MAG TPA: hypothetical protein VFX97_16880 [Pyrinomonadaceae bacterium]|nr:hypothetical protein [Pyrinomonadaceae bacterium]